VARLGKRLNVEKERQISPYRRLHNEDSHPSPTDRHSEAPARGMGGMDLRDYLDRRNAIEQLYRSCSLE
jgi:hypothetical protein